MSGPNAPPINGMMARNGAAAIRNMPGMMPSDTAQYGPIPGKTLPPAASSKPRPNAVPVQAPQTPAPVPDRQPAPPVPQTRSLDAPVPPVAGALPPPGQVPLPRARPDMLEDRFNYATGALRDAGLPMAQAIGAKMRGMGVPQVDPSVAIVARGDSFTPPSNA